VEFFSGQASARRIPPGGSGTAPRHCGGGPAEGGGFAARYDTESHLNQVVAQLFELQVRQSNSSADRHNARSQLFFAGMLGAQLAVILASIGLAVQRRNLLWGFAAVIGIAALGFGIYVFVYV
jgi:hypothetical protein